MIYVLLGVISGLIGEEVFPSSDDVVKGLIFTIVLSLILSTVFFSMGF